MTPEEAFDRFIPALQKVNDAASVLADAGKELIEVIEALDPPTREELRRMAEPILEPLFERLRAAVT